METTKKVQSINIEYSNRKRGMVLIDPVSGIGTPDEYRKTVLHSVAEKLGFLPEDIKLAWSQTCGCKCPCSPGFFLTCDPKVKGIPEFTPSTCKGLVMTVRV